MRTFLASILAFSFLLCSVFDAAHADLCHGAENAAGVELEVLVVAVDSEPVSGEEQSPDHSGAHHHHHGTLEPGGQPLKVSVTKSSIGDAENAISMVHRVLSKPPIS